ncbi:MAG TPA: neuraminidase-like domain-containing protein [Pyrinomonadaceae bacterium]|nr:neuraminidase-like domain-containing protein [Pyrinomonadaceae bacterium]
MPKENSTRVVWGIVTDGNNHPLAELRVRAFDRDMRSETLLGEDVTDARGRYRIEYLAENFVSAEKKSADLSMKVFGPNERRPIYETDFDRIVFNAAAFESIDISIPTAIRSEENEFDFILREISGLTGEIKTSDLDENEKHRDLTFLSREAGIQPEKLHHLVVAHRLQDESKIDAAFFYALLRKNTLLKNKLDRSLRMRLSIDINTEIRPLLFEAALAEPERVERDVKAAIAENIVPERVGKEAPKHIAALKRLQQQAQDYYEKEHLGRVFNIVTRFATENKIAEIGELFRENKNNPLEFIKKITDASFFKTESDANDAQVAVRLAELLGSNDKLIAEVTKAEKIKKTEDVRKLARLNRAGWKELLDKTTAKIKSDDKGLDKNLIDFHAISLTQRMEREFPAVAFAAQLEREKKPVFKNHERISSFFNEHEDFDLQRSNVDVFLNEKKLNREDNDGLRKELKSAQRIFRLIPNYRKTTELLRKDIHSAQSISAMGESRFVKEIAPEAGLTKDEAKTIFRKAEKTTAAAMIIAGELQDTIRTADIAALKMKSLSSKLEAVSKDFPNLKTLFNLADVCACEHCRSVYSPAAYMVEILQFLDNRSVIDLNTNAPNIAKDVLFERRPDLGDIDLGCENATTPVPYIDLVCELLEEAIAPDPGVAFTGNLSVGPDPLTGKISNALLSALVAAKIPVTDQALIFHTETTGGFPSNTLPHYLRDKEAVCKIVNTGGNNYVVKRLRQTLASAEELAAAPAYVNQAAYDELKDKSFVFVLPFDLNDAEAHGYFSRFDIERHVLMSDFQVSGTPDDVEIAAARFGLTETERFLIVGPDTADQHLHWNTATPDAPLELSNVDRFLTKTGLKYAELELLLAIEFIDPADNLFIQHSDIVSCDTATKTIANLDIEALDRIHRFLRLQKETRWSFETLAEIIGQAKLGDKKLDNACLKKAAALVKVSKATGIKLEQLLGFYGEFPHDELPAPAKKPLYHQVFLNKAKNGFIDEGLLPEKVDGGAQPLTNFITTLSVCLQISVHDLEKLLPILPGANVEFSTLSSLYALSILIRKLKFKTDDFLILRELSGIDPTASPEDTIEFLDVVAAARQFPLKPAELKFMLLHEATNLVDRELPIDKIQFVLEKLQGDYKKADAANRSPFDPALTADEQKEALQTLLSKLRDVAEDDVKTFVKFIDRDWTSVAAAKLFVDAKLDDLFDTGDIKTGIDLLDAATPATLEAQRNNLVKLFLDAISVFQYKADIKLSLQQTIATTFKVSPEFADAVLYNAKLKQPLPGTSGLGDLLLADAFLTTAIAEPAFQAQFDAIRLLHKLFPLATSFKFDEETVVFYLKHNTALGWFELDAIPYKGAQTDASFDLYRSFVGMVGLSKQLTPVPNPADAEQPITFFTVGEMLLPGGPTTRAEWLLAFSLITEYPFEHVDTIDAHLFVPFDLANYRLAETWQRMERCTEHLRKLGCTVKQVTNFIKPVLTASETSELRTALKARYEEDTWLSTLKEITDSIRPQKRDALVAYLLAVNPDMKDDNDLYDFFLVDTQMASCMPSSRIVQAHGTIQLFVQRCLMGLEPKAAADLDNDPKWNQWKWMKNYRVWEANRKVFLYPENWIEAELRDDKSFLFKELEDELLQNELTEFSAEQALIKYLEKLDAIAFLEVVATWYQSDIKTMHVFARTKGGDPSIYYYRRFEQERAWTPWEKVELDITGDHLLAFVRNNRLSLAWPVFTEEPDPNPQSTVPNINDPGPVPTDKPAVKLKIQLAISEFANNQWQPKRVSSESIKTPSNYTTSALPRDIYNLLYFEAGDQIWLFSTTFVNAFEAASVNGVFSIAGCKGYPELIMQGEMPFPDFYPDFKDAPLRVQRYKEWGIVAGDELAQRNILSLSVFYTLLNATPGRFRLSYPLQMTMLDFVLFFLQYILSLIFRRERQSLMKIPLGTLLPYFMEDSNRGYVIVPGLYRTDKDPNSGEPIFVRRTASDIMQLIEDIIKLAQKYIALYLADPLQDMTKFWENLQADPDFQEIFAEIKIYTTLNYGEQFRNMYHPLVCPLRTIMYRDGIPQLMKRETQMQVGPFKFDNTYQPTPLVPAPRPIEDIDFSSDGSYSSYNWELFFHVPFLLATRLTKDQKFEEALTWFHYIFNPTGALPGTAPQKYWVTKPFFLTQASDYVDQRIDTLLYKIANPNTPEIAELEFAIDQWREKPFRPHVIARFRPVAYQKAVLMKYIDNLVEWGDYLFRQDTMESIAQATQMYILADKLLGPKPRIVPPAVKPPYETYDQIERKLDAFGNALIDLENILPDLSVLPEGGEELPPAPITLSTLYFCIPQNDKMLEYWDRIADRLFNIRHCRNIDGVERSLALFAPPIDPGALVRAAAAGLDMSSILAGLNAPTPFYRFNVLSQKAADLVQEIRNLGNSLLQALEKKDAENLALLRSELEIKVLKAVRETKLLQIEEAREQIEILKRTEAVTEEKNTYYTNIEKIISNEQLNLDKLGESHTYQMQSQVVRTIAGSVALVPEFHVGASGFGGSPEVVLQLGGMAMSRSTSIGADILNILSAVSSYEANRASILGGYDRRFEDWKLQERVAKKELDQIKRQMVAAEIRLDLAEADLKNHDLQIENAKKTDEFMRSKYTNKDLYTWMIGQISSVYFRAYKLAYDVAKKAERCYRFELGNDDTFIGFGYWDSLKKGLQSADMLFHDIKRMETSYLDKNKREYEVTKHISLALVDPLALVRLRATGVCDFEIPEALYDMDHPGQYFRRLKTVSVSLPCIAGPYTSVSAKLSLVSNKYRKNTAKAQGAGTPKEEYEEVIGNDERFVYNVGAIQSIAASNSQNDSGMFELNFRDERYLPFEGCGAAGSWRLELPAEVRQFAYETISDVVLHVKYTAREGGSSLRNLAAGTLVEKLQEIKQQLGKTGLHVALNMKHDLPNEWHLLKTTGAVNLTIDKSRLPFFAQSLAPEIENVIFVARAKSDPATYTIKINDADMDLAQINTWHLCQESTNAITLETPFKLSLDAAELADLEDLMIVTKFTF